MPAVAPEAQIAVRHCHGLAEFSACFDIQRAVWGSADADLTPLPLFVVAAETGGQVLGAFADDRMVGFTLALAGLHGKEPFLHSHMTAVLDGWRDRGIGRRLKLFQREDALSRGIDRIDWSFDPLQIKNAYINMVRLGAIARRFIPNMYGAFSSPLQGGLPTDRLIAEWHLKSPRVKRAIATTSNDKRDAARKPVAARGGKIVRIRVPGKMLAARMTQPDEALRMQAEVRQEFEHWLKLGYAATHVTVTRDGLGGDYFLEPWEKD
jgi:predicted GNAT superfamily acetyltransferase